ncbi:MAG: TadE/TadG family type IV pilus assembly protein [Clostridia bacterium]
MKRPGGRQERGQALVEYLIVFPSLLLVILGAVQFALLYHMKNTLQYAAFAAARQGSLKNAKMNTIKDALAAGLTPMFTFKPDMGSLAKGRAIAAIEVYNPLTMKVELLSPTKEAGADFGSDDPADSGKRLIPNDNLMYRASSTGGSSGVNVQDANLLKIRVTYCAKLVVPVVNVAIYGMLNGITGAKDLAGEWFGDPVTTSVATTPNMCSQLKDRIGSKVDAVVDAAGDIGVDISFLNDALFDISSAVSGFTVPGLDWEIGGYRIPITAEAVVRMQSPAQVEK